MAACIWSRRGALPCVLERGFDPSREQRRPRRRSARGRFDASGSSRNIPRVENIEFDDGRLPLLLKVHFKIGVPTDAEFEAYLARYDTYLRQWERFSVMFVTAPSMPMTKPRHAKMQATWMKAHEALIRQRVRGAAFVLPSPVARGVLRAILRMQGMPTAHAVFRDEGEAVAWIESLGDEGGRQDAG